MNQDIKVVLPQGELDIDTQIGFGVTYSVDDIRDISKKNSNFTKTVTLPGSKNNNILMGGLFDINADFTYFNPNFKTAAKIVVDSTTILDGYLQLKNIKKMAVADFAGNYIQYEVVLFDDSIDFITEIGDKLLTDLSFSAYNHTYDKPTIEASWTNTYTDVYTYPLLYKGSDVYATSDFKPGIYHRAYLEKIFETNGYTFGGSFFDNETYKKEVIPFNGQTVALLPSEFTRRNFRAGMTGNTPTLSTTTYKGGIVNPGTSGAIILNPTIQTSLSAYTYLNDDSTLPNFDNDNHFDIVTSTYTADRNGTYNINGLLNFQVKFESKIEFTGITSGTTMSRIKITYPNHQFDSGTLVIITGSTLYDGSYNIASVTANEIEIAEPFVGDDSGTMAVNTYQYGYYQNGNQYGSGGFNNSASNYGGTYSIGIQMLKNGVYVQNFNSSGTYGFPRANAFDATFDGSNNWERTANHKVNILRPNLYLLSGDVITLKYVIQKTPGSESIANKVRYQDTTDPNTFRLIPLRIKLTSFTGITTNDAYLSSTAQHSEMTDGDTIYLNDYIAQKVKQIDIINDVIKRYNLYITNDPNDDKKIILDSRDDFYSASTQTLDWTLLKDFSVEDKIELLSELQNKEVLFTYKADGDDWNKNYTSATSGDSKGQIFGQKKVEFDNEFAKGEKKIESIFSPTPNAYNSVNQRFIIPTIPAVNPKTNVRILLNNGMKDPVNTSDNNGVYSWYWDWYSGNTAQRSYFLQYPYYSHNNDPYNPTDDINWGEVPWEYHAEQETITDNNLYNRYWKNYITQIATGRLVTSRFYLTEVDINKVKNALNTRIFVDGTYYYINKIVDFDPTKKGETTEVQLLKINNPVVFTPTVSTGTTVFTPYEAMRLVQPPVVNNTNTILSKNVIVGGDNNFVGPNSDGAVIIGDDNIIGENFRGVVIGSGITANEGGIYLENAYIATDGTIYNLSGETVSNNFCDSGIATSVITSCDNGNIDIGGGSIFGAKSYIISGITNAIYLDSSYGDITSSFSPQLDLYIETNIYENYLIASVSASTFDGTNTIIFINDDINDYVNNWFNALIIIETGTTITNNILIGKQNIIGGNASYSMVQGQFNYALGSYAHCEGRRTIASGSSSHSEGFNTISNGEGAHSEGIKTTANGDFSHAEGGGTTANGEGAHSEGQNTTANGDFSHSEGFNTISNGFASHAAGQFTTANGIASTSFGSGSTANGNFSFACGENNETNSFNTGIFAGQNSTITTGSTRSVILGGQSNLVISNDSAVLGGVGNILSGTRSVILGGQNITGSTNDTVYVPNLNIQTGKSINTNNGGGQIDLDYGGVADDILISTDSGAFLENYIYTSPTNGTYISDLKNTNESSLLTLSGSSINLGIRKNVGGSSQYYGGIDIGLTRSNNFNSEILGLGDVGVIINSLGSVINSGVTNSVIIGGTNITATTANTVYMPAINIQSNGGISFGTGNTMVMVEVPINDWNMDSTSFVTINTGLGLSSGQTKSIRQVSVIIRDDTDSSYKSLDYADSVNTTPNGYWEIMTTDQIYLERRISGGFDSTSYDSTSYNRGFITFWYNPNA